MDQETLIDLVRQHMGSVRIPGNYDKVYKDECMFTFDTPESAGGLYVNLKTFQGYGDEYVDLDHERTGQVLYFHEKWHRLPIPEEEKAAASVRPDKLALGGEGGFQVENNNEHKVEKERALLLMPARLRIALPCPQLPEKVLQSINALMAHTSASTQERLAVWEEERRESRYARTLPQLDNGRKISSDPSSWKCDDTGVTENLWLNLSTGHIGSGRRHFDGSGGNGSALAHYHATGSRYPLAVKLGTITPHGGDVYSYAPDEDDMVEDPLLAQHLAHWGINMMNMEKTEKTMAELQIDINMSFEFDKITEAGSELRPLAGPGYVGLSNLGNSCYMNSVLQLLFMLPTLRTRYVDAADHIFRTAPQDVPGDVPTQVAKLGVALLKGRTGAPPEAQTGPPNGVGGPLRVVEADGDAEMVVGEEEGPRALAVKPQFFKSLIGRGHPEFSSAHQQDAVEYLQYLLEVMSRAERGAGGRLPDGGRPATADAFKFELEDRIQCLESGRVSYRRAGANVWGLPIPLEAAANKVEVEEYRERELKRQKLKEAGAAAYISQDGGSAGSAVIAQDSREDPVLPRVPFESCVAAWAAAEGMEDYLSAALGRRGPASKCARFASFPPYLLIQMRRYYVASDWSAKKMEVEVDVPEELDLERLRGRGPQLGESLQPEDAEDAPSAAPAAASPAPQPDPAIVSQLVSMGFSENGCKRAALAIGNSSAEAAMEWVFAHMEDPDFNDPLPPPAQTAGSPPAVSPEAVAALTPMGFSEEQAAVALQACGGSVERAADWLFSHLDNLDAAVAAANGQPSERETAAPAAGVASKVDDGPGRYQLVGFISHMGSNTACGHYVCHIKKAGRWVIFNDEKVAESEHPPKGLGYLYMFKRRA